MNTHSQRSGPATLLVGVSNPATADRLVRISDLLTGERPWDILLTHVVTVANQIGLTTGKGAKEGRDECGEHRGFFVDVGHCWRFIEDMRSDAKFCFLVHLFGADLDLQDNAVLGRDSGVN